MQYALELKNVHYAYHTLEGETYALKDITFSVRGKRSHQNKRQLSSGQHFRHRIYAAKG